MTEKNGQNGKIVEIMGTRTSWTTSQKKRRGNRQTDENISSDGHSCNCQCQTVTAKSAFQVASPSTKFRPGGRNDQTSKCTSAQKPKGDAARVASRTGNSTSYAEQKSQREEKGKVEQFCKKYQLKR